MQKAAAPKLKSNIKTKKSVQKQKRALSTKVKKTNAKKAVASNDTVSVPMMSNTTSKAFRPSNKLSAAEPEKKQIKDYLEFSLTSPNFSPYNKSKAHAVYVATTHGERGILRNAAALVATLRPGVCRVYEESTVTDPKKFFLPAGVVRIANDDKALEVTASEIIPVEELDGDAAKRLLETATAAAAATTDAVAKAQHTITMRVANAIVKAAEKYKV